MSDLENMVRVDQELTTVRFTAEAEIMCGT